MSKSHPETEAKSRRLGHLLRKPFSRMDGVATRHLAGIHRLSRLISLVVIAACMLVTASVAQKSVINPPCLDAYAKYIAGNMSQPMPGLKVYVQLGVIDTWVFTGTGLVKYSIYGEAAGSAQNPIIAIWPHALKIELGDFCSPAGLAAMFPTLAHELLHFVCPPHEGAVGDPPDCNDINYAFHAAAALCEELGRVVACLTNPQCIGLKDEEGNVFDGVPKADLKEYCKELKKAHAEMQANWNTADVAATAYNCNCGPTNWVPGTGYPNCPVMGPPPGGCASVADAYPENKVIPDCAATCPE